MYSVCVYTGVSCSPTVLSSDLISLYRPTYTESPFLCKVVCNGACGLSLQATSEKISGYLQGKWPTVSLFFVTLQFIHQIVKLLFGVKFLPCCRFPNILINMVSPNSRIDSKFIILPNYDSKCFAKTQTPLHVSSLAAKQSFVSFQMRTNFSQFQLNGVFCSYNIGKVVSTDKQTRYGEYKQKLRYMYDK